MVLSLRAGAIPSAEPLQNDSLARYLCGYPDAVQPLATRCRLQTNRPPTSCPGSIEQLRTTVPSLLRSGCGFAAPAEPSRPIPFALVKTHKTGSSTLAMLLARVGLAQRMRYVGCKYAVGRQWFYGGGCAHLFRNATAGSFGYEVRHLLPMASWWTTKPASNACDRGDGRWFDQLVETYVRLMGRGVQVVMPLREAASHAMSVLSYYHKSLVQFRTHRQWWNPQSLDLRLTKPEHVDAFLSRWAGATARKQEAARGAVPVGSLHPVLLERLDESLCALRRHLRWPLRAVVYAKAIVPASRRKANHSKDATVPPRTIELDARIHRAFGAHLNRSIARASHRRWPTPFAQEVHAINRLSVAAARLCSAVRTRRVPPPESAADAELLADFCLQQKPGEYEWTEGGMHAPKWEKRACPGLWRHATTRIKSPPRNASRTASAHGPGRHTQHLAVRGLPPGVYAHEAHRRDEVLQWGAAELSGVSGVDLR